MASQELSDDNVIFDALWDRMVEYGYNGKLNKFELIAAFTHLNSEISTDNIMNICEAMISTYSTGYNLIDKQLWISYCNNGVNSTYLQNIIRKFYSSMTQSANIKEEEVKNNKAIFEDLYRYISDSCLLLPYVAINPSQWINKLKTINTDIDQTEMFDIYEKVTAGSQDRIKKSNWDLYWKYADKKYIEKFKTLQNILVKNIDRDNIKITNKTNALCCYQWRLPRHQTSQIELIFCGFARLNCNKFVPYDIINICIYYFGHDFQRILQQYKDREKGKSEFRSGIIEYKSCLFCIKFDPNYYFWHLEFINGPPNISKIEIDCRFTLMEKFMQMSINNDCKVKVTETISLSPSASMKFEDIKYLNSLTYNLFITKFTGISQDGDILFCDEVKKQQHDDEQQTDRILFPIVVNETIFDSDESAIYEWKLCEKKFNLIKTMSPGDVSKSEIFIIYGLRWQIWLFPNGDNQRERGKCEIYLVLIGLPIKIQTLHIYYEIAMGDKNLDKAEEFMTFTEDETFMYLLEDEALSFNEITHHQNPSFNLSMQLLGIFDKNGEKINLSDLNLNPQNYISSSINRYQWNVTQSMLGQIKEQGANALTKSFFSPLFQLYSCIFVLEMYPQTNKDDDDQDDEKKDESEGNIVCMIDMHLVKAPGNIKTITTNESFSLKETGSKYEWINEYTSLMSSSWSEDVVLWHDIVNKLQSLTWICDMQLLNVYDNNGQNITQNIIDNDQDEKMNVDALSLPKAQCFQWKVPKKLYKEDVKKGNVYKSDIFDMFGFTWYLWLVPKREGWSEEISVFICRADYPLNVSSISAHCKVVILETKTAWSYTQKFNEKKSYFGAWDIQKRDEIQDLEYLTINVEIILFQVIDINHKDITNQFIDCDDNHIKNHRALRPDMGKANSWAIDIKNDANRIDSDWFMIKEHEIEYKMQLIFKNNDGRGEILVLIKSLPIGIKGISLMCNIEMRAGFDGESEVNISGVVHFTPSKSKCLLIDIIEIDPNVLQYLNVWLIQIKVMEIYGTKLVITDKTNDKKVCGLIDELLTTFS